MEQSPHIQAARDYFLSPATTTAAVLVVVGGLLWLWALVDSLRLPDTTWQGAGQSKVVWVMVIILLGPLGALLYLLIAKAALRRATA